MTSLSGRDVVLRYSPATRPAAARYNGNADVYIPRQQSIFDEDDEDEYDENADEYDLDDRQPETHASKAQRALEKWWQSIDTRQLAAVLLAAAILFLLTSVGLAAYGIALSDDVKHDVEASASSFAIDVSGIECDQSLLPQTFLVGTGGNSSTASVLFADTLYALQLVDQGFSSPAYPVWLSRQRHFWTVDKRYNRVNVYDALTRAQIDEFYTDALDCDGPFSPYYHPEAGKVWMACQHTNNFLVLEAGSRAHVATVDVPPGIAATHAIGPLVLGHERAVVVFNPDMLAVYDATTTPPTLLSEQSILSSTGFNALWRNAYLDDADLFVFSSSTQTIYKLEWRSWTVLDNRDMNAEVVAMTTDGEDRWLYAAVMPRHLEALTVSDMTAIADGTAPVTENFVTAVSVNIGADYVSVGDDRGLVRRYDIMSDSGAPDYAGSVREYLASASFTAVGGIVRANLGCPCDDCLKDASE